MSDGEQPVLGFRVGVFNWRLKRAREQAGLTMEQLAERSGMHVSRLYAIQGLREKPTEAQADRLSIALMTPVDDLFPGLIDDLISRIGTVEVPLTESQVRSLASSGEDEHLRRITVRQALLPFASRLTRVEKGVLAQRLTQDPHNRPTVDEVAAALETTPERVRQVEGALLRRLRDRPIARALWSEGPA